MTIDDEKDFYIKVGSAKDRTLTSMEHLLMMLSDQDSMDQLGIVRDELMLRGYCMGDVK